MRAKPKEKQILLFIFEMRILTRILSYILMNKYNLFIIYIYNN